MANHGWLPDWVVSHTSDWTDAPDLGAGLAATWSAGTPVGVRFTCSGGVHETGSGTPARAGCGAASAVAGTAAIKVLAERNVIVRSTKCRNDFRCI
ncbi:hypothetical protein GCM10017567_75050 [Amycolatopsis bullii]|uniref:Uncharacterized protein n=1 Tax=Amycolatopsis bullii TaxID=941987 RepID=A0ABQ3KRU7_9PSEU|nr:hypothetical protein GCM10017567_75050 [Amycolatopsis bullii]